ncbi:hypothetical protein K435DRAFT_669594, partial [Dendrothele bispora CBS 962.96]
YYGTVDIIMSLLGFAVVIDSLILILASVVFFYGHVDGAADVDLFDTYDLIEELVESGMCAFLEPWPQMQRLRKRFQDH